MSSSNGGSGPTNTWMPVIVALLSLVGVLLAALIGVYGSQRAATEVAIFATQTAEAKQTAAVQTAEAKQTAAAQPHGSTADNDGFKQDTPGEQDPPESSTSEPIVPTGTPTSTPTETPLPTYTPTPIAADVQPFPIEVLASADKGVEWCTNAAGEHMIRYVRGAYSPFPTDDGCDPKGCWKGSVFVYKNATADAVFANEPKGEPINPLFVVGWNDWLPTAADIESKRLEDRSIRLERGDCLRFITVDARDAYHWPADNRGAVQLEVLAPDTGMCFGTCWQVDEAAQTLTWTGPADGSEDIWLGSDEYLQKVRSGYAAILENTVPLKVDICVGQIDGQQVAADCTPQILDLASGRHTIVSAGLQGGFRVGLNLAGPESINSSAAPLVQVGPYRNYRSSVQAETLLLNIVSEGTECMPSVDLTIDDAAYVANLLGANDPQGRNEWIPGFGSSGGWSCNYEIAASRPIIPQKYISVPSAAVGIDMPGWCFTSQNKTWTPC